jgi:DNA-binding NarL/FixJ family response regulator
MDQSKVHVLLVSLPGIFQRVLNGLFSDRPEVQVVDIATGGLSALHAMEIQRPDIVVIDANIPESEAVETVRVIRAQYPHIYSLALTETTQQHYVMDQAGPDLVLRSTELQANIEAIIQGVLRGAGDNHAGGSGEKD